jgi:hypothetical protein
MMMTMMMLMIVIIITIVHSTPNFSNHAPSV